MLRRDLEAGWEADAARKRVEVTAAEAIASFVIDVEAARQTTWEFLTAPGHRVMWTAGATAVEEDVANGRRGAGTVNHCMHGKDVIIEEVLDWQPPITSLRISAVRHRRQLRDPRADRRRRGGTRIESALPRRRRSCWSVSCNLGR